MKVPNAVFVSLGKLHRATFIERPNRFLVRCELQVGQNDESRVVDAHLADPGRLRELLIPGRTIWLRSENNPSRRTRWSAVLCQTPDEKGLISIQSTLPNHLVAKALAAQSMEEFEGWSLLRSEFRMGNSRWDFLLGEVNGSRRLVLEVKSVTLVRDRVALFPDAVTARGARHVSELVEIVRRPNWEAAVLFVVQRDDAERVRAEHEVDPEFARALRKARNAGIRLLARRCRIGTESVMLGERIPVE